MDITCKTTPDGVTARLVGEIDQHNAAIARAELDAMIEAHRPQRFGLDLSGVTFCDSSGLGLVMGRMKKCSSEGSTLVVIDPSKEALKILQIAGMDRILKIERGEKR